MMFRSDSELYDNLFLTQAPVTEAEAREVTKKIGASGYFETSAKEVQGVTELFTEAARIACSAPKKKKNFTQRFLPGNVA